MLDRTIFIFLALLGHGITATTMFYCACASNFICFGSLSGPFTTATSQTYWTCDTTCYCPISPPTTVNLMDGLPYGGYVTYYFDLPSVQGFSITYDSSVSVGSILAPIKVSGNTNIPFDLVSTTWSKNDGKQVFLYGRYCTPGGDPNYQSTAVAQLTFASSHTGSFSVSSFAPSGASGCPDAVSVRTGDTTSEDSGSGSKSSDDSGGSIGGGVGGGVFVLGAVLYFCLFAPPRERNPASRRVMPAPNNERELPPKEDVGIDRGPAGVKAVQVRAPEHSTELIAAKASGTANHHYHHRQDSECEKSSIIDLENQSECESR
jgi:hypothetical protein